MQLGGAEIVVGLVYMAITTVISIWAFVRAMLRSDRDRLVQYLQQKLADAEKKIEALQEEAATQRAEIAALQRLPFSQLSELGTQLAAGATKEHAEIIRKLDFISDMHAGAVEMGRRIAEQGG